MVNRPDRPAPQVQRQVGEHVQPAARQRQLPRGRSTAEYLSGARALPSGDVAERLPRNEAQDQRRQRDAKGEDPEHVHRGRGKQPRAHAPQPIRDDRNDGRLSAK